MKKIQKIYPSVLAVVLPYLILALLWFGFFDWVAYLWLAIPPNDAIAKIWKDGVFVVASVNLLFLLIRRTLRMHEQAERELKQREAMLHTIIDSMGDIVFTLDRDQRHTGIFGSWAQRYGLTADFFLGKTSRDISGVNETTAIHEAANVAALNGETTVYEWFAGPVHVQTVLSPITNGGGEVVGVVGVGRDISSLKKIERELLKINRAYHMLSTCNQVLVRAPDEPTLLQQICQSIVEVGGYRMAWVGFADQDKDKTVIPVAQAGYEEGYLKAIQVSWANSSYGPVGTAVHTRKPSVTRNIQMDKNFPQWRDDAINRGYASIIALPLLFGNNVGNNFGNIVANARATQDAPPGVVAIYASEPDAFDTAEIALLTELAEDLVYGIQNLRVRGEYQRTAARLANILEIAASAIITVDANHRIQLFNPAAEIISGYQTRQVLNKPFSLLLDPSSIQTYYEYADEIANLKTAQRSGAYCEVLARRRDTKTFPVELSLAHIAQNNEISYTIIMHDISAQKQAEEDLIFSRNRIQMILESITDAFFSLDIAWNFVYLNREAERLLRKTREELLEQNIWEMFPEAVTTIFFTEYHQTVNEQKSTTFETYYAPMGIWFDVHAYPSREGLSVYFRDITERRKTEDELHRVNQALRVLSECNQALVRANNETELLQTICQSIVQSGGYRMAWIGFAELEGEKMVVPVAQAGYAPSYLSNLSITWDESELGKGPTGRAIRTRIPQVVNNMFSDPNYTPWQERAQQYGYASSVALPLFEDFPHQSVPVLGTLNIYASTADVFDATAIELLSELAHDVVYGIVALRTRAEHRELLAQVQQAHERLQMLSRRLVEVQEQERRHIARELHDEIGQSLTGLHLLLEMISRGASGPIESKLNDAHALVSDLMSRVRELSLDLRPAMLDDLGLLPTLRWHFQRYTTQTSIQVRFKHTDVDRRFSPEAETVVYRLVQEALTNVARYANVTEVTVRLWSDIEGIGVQIEDAGCGFNPVAILASNMSSGLAGMRERVSLLGGELTIESVPGQGTCLSAEIPHYHSKGT